MMTSVQKTTVFVSTITSFITTFMGSALNLAVPVMSEEFGASAGAAGWLITVYMLIAAAFSVPFGRAADLTAGKYILVCGISVFGLASLYTTFSTGMAGAIAGRGLQGLGAAMLFATNQAILMNEFDKSERGKVLGYSTAATYLGLTLGPVAGGILNHYAGWRSIFGITFIISLVVFVLSLTKLPLRKNDIENKKADVTGSILFIISVILSIYGLSSITEGIIYITLFIAGIILAVLFVLKERKTVSPVIDVSLFAGNRSYTLSNIAAFLNYGATFAISYLISVYLQVISGYDSQTAGLILIAAPLMQTLFSPYAGRLSDRVSPFRLASAGMAITTVALIIFIFLKEETSIITIVITLLITGIGFALFSSPNTNAIMSCVDGSSYGVATSVLATMRSLGHTVSMAIVTIVTTVNIGELTLMESSSDMLIKTIDISFIIFTILSLAGIFCSLKRSVPRKSH